MSQYYIAKTVSGDLDTVEQRVTEVLKAHGFGVLTRIDVAATLKEKLDADLAPYVILGACSPKHAHAALQAENKIGLMLPCNVILQDVGHERVEVAAVDPVASMQAIENDSLGEVAAEVQARLKEVVHAL